MAIAIQIKNKNKCLNISNLLQLVSKYNPIFFQSSSTLMGQGWNLPSPTHLSFLFQKAGTETTFPFS